MKANNEAITGLLESFDNFVSRPTNVIGYEQVYGTIQLGESKISEHLKDYRSQPGVMVYLKKLLSENIMDVSETARKNEEYYGHGEYISDDMKQATISDLVETDMYYKHYKPGTAFDYQLGELQIVLNTGIYHWESEVYSRSGNLNNLLIFTYIYKGSSFDDSELFLSPLGRFANTLLQSSEIIKGETILAQ